MNSLSFSIVEDVAQKAGKHKRKHAYFERMGLEIVQLPLPVADYVLMNDRIADVIDRKNKRGIPVKKLDLLGTYDRAVDTKCSMTELYTNLIQQHARFHDEVHLAMNNDIELYILVENKDGIKNTDDVKKWANPRIFKYCKDKKQAGKTGRIPPRPPASNVQLIKIMHSMHRDYGVEFVFCSPQDAGKRVIELLEG